MRRILLILICAALPLEEAFAQNLPGCLFKNHRDALGRIDLNYKTLDNEEKSRSGTGFVISPDGLMLTARHVVSTKADETMQSLSVSFGRSEYGAAVETEDEKLDVALLQLERRQDPWPTVPVNKSPSAEPGDWIVALGFPRGFEATVTSPAVVSSLNTLLDGQFRLWWQTSLDLTEGMSGGPVFDASGAVVGMSVRRHTELTDVSYVLSTRNMGDFLDRASDLREDGPCREVQSQTPSCRVCFRQASGAGCVGSEASCSAWSDVPNGSPEKPTADDGWSGAVRVGAGVSGTNRVCDLQWRIECR